MGTKGLCVLVVNDDLTCRKVVDEMLQHCNYEVLRIGDALDVLNTVWEAKDRIELVLTNAHKLESNGIEIVQHIEKKFNLPITLMSPDRMKIVSKGQRCNFAAYMLNGLSTNAVKNLWEFAFEKEKAKKVAANQGENCQRGIANNNAVVMEKSNPSSSISEGTRCKRKEMSTKNEDGREDSPIQKKQRVVWTAEMHQKFLEAIEIIGYEKAVPKKIVEIMGIPGITRENVASHLQKFRGGLKRNQEISLSSLLESRRTNELQESRFLQSNPTSRLNSLFRNSYSLLQQNSSTSNTRQSNCLLSPHYLQNTISAESHYTNIGTYGTEKMQQNYVPRVQLNRNFRIYGDQTKNMLLTLSNSTSSTTDQDRSNGCKFVGYRLTSDGNSIEFGKKGVDDRMAVNSEFPFTSFIQKNPIFDQNPPMPTACISHQQQPFMSSGNENTHNSSTFSLPHQETYLQSPANEAAVQIPFIPPQDIQIQQSPVQPSGAYLENKSTFSLPYQETYLQSPANEAAIQIPFIPPQDIPIQHSPVQPSGAYLENEPSSVFLQDQDFPLPELETSGNDLPDRNLYFEEGSQKLHPSPSQLQQMVQELSDCIEKDHGIDDNVVMSGTESSVPQFDLEEFDDTLFNYDD